MDKDDDLGMSLIDELIGFASEEDEVVLEEEIKEEEVREEEKKEEIEEIKEEAEEIKEEKEEEVIEEKPDPVEEKEEKEEEVQEEVTPEVEKPSEEDVNKAREAARKQLEETFAISEEDATLLQEEPEKVMPRLMSNAAIMMYDMVQQNILQAIPGLMQQVNSQSNSENEARDAFYENNPVLKGVKGVEEQIPAVAEVIKKNNPNISRDQLIVKVGKTIQAVLGIEDQAPVAKKTVAKKTGHKPSAPSSVTAPPPTAESLTAEEQLINDIIDLGV